MKQPLPAPGDMLDLRDSVVLITGAGGGVGSGIARRFSRAGASIVLHYRSSGDAVEALATELGVPSVTAAADLRDSGSAQAAVDAALEGFGKLDAVVNNAGVQPRVGFDSMTEAEWREMIDVNLTGTHFVTMAAARWMAATGQGGSITHIASTSALRPRSHHGHYSTSKAAVVMHAQAAALEYGQHDIRVNAVSPGFVHRPGIETEWPDGVEQWKATVPLTRLGTPEDVGDACVFLASPMARWITGMNLVVDGGLSIRSAW